MNYNTIGAGIRDNKTNKDPQITTNKHMAVADISGCTLRCGGADSILNLYMSHIGSINFKARSNGDISCEIEFSGQGSTYVADGDDDEPDPR